MPATYEPIATTTLGSNAAEIEFTGIPSTYTDLKVVMQFAPTTTMYLVGRFNNDGALAYSETTLYGQGSGSPISTNHSAYTIWQIEPFTFSSGNTYLFTMDIYDYARSGVAKAFSQTVAADQNGSGYIYYSVGYWNRTSVINSLKMYYQIDGINYFAAGTTATVYGILRA